MAVPESLDSWTYDVVGQLAELGQVETSRHDFKFSLPDPDTLTKICCAFANSEGGFIVFGVKDRSGHYLLEGIPPDGEIARDFGHKLKAAPSIAFDVPKLLTIPGSANVLYVFHVPQSGYRPHVPTRADKRVFWKRTNVGCEQMTLEEIRSQFLGYEERRDRIKLLLIELLLNKEQLEGITAVGQGSYSLDTLDSSVLDRLLVDTYSLLQDEPKLIKILVTLRVQIRASNAKARIFFSQMALPLSDSATIAASHNEFMKQKAGFLIPLINEAVQIIEQRFGLTNPLPE